MKAINDSNHFKQITTYNLSGLCLILFLLIAGCNQQASSKNTAVRQLIESIQNDIPIGTPQADVQEYLDHQQIESSYNAETNQYRGIIRKTSQNGFVIENLAFVIDLDNNNLVSEITIETKYTGP